MGKIITDYATQIAEDSHWLERLHIQSEAMKCIRSNLVGWVELVKPNADKDFWVSLPLNPTYNFSLDLRVNAH